MPKVASVYEPERAHENGCAAFFRKPIDGTVLAATITTLAAR